VGESLPASAGQLSSKPLGAISIAELHRRGGN